VRLALQVMFAQGYLWRDRFPGYLESKQGHVSMHWLALGMGAVFLAAGSVGVIDGDIVLYVLYLPMGVAFLAGSWNGFGVSGKIGSRAFWVSFSWAAGTIGIMCMFLEMAIALSIAIVDERFQSVIIFSTLALFLLLPGLWTILQIERRILFFSDPVRNASVLQDGMIHSLVGAWKEAFIFNPLWIGRMIINRSRVSSP